MEQQKKNAYVLRPACADDAAALLAVYAPYVAQTAVTFEYEIPSEAEFAARIARIGAEYPYLVCERAGSVLGYAYAHRHMERAAYGWNAELSIYLASWAQGRGVGTALYRALEVLLARQHVRNLYACITLPNEKSVRLHEKMGFSYLGAYHRSGWKNGSWHDVGWFEKRLGGEQAPQPFIPIAQINGREKEACLLVQMEMLNDKGE
ncbi:MAG: GNAT family N-acetyltransferase [Agathobaculum sp.]|jgi:L-amino acid N-acyltransferase YncA|uniref:N-acetyltransferase family protein n=1 Tax=Agathobaculum sp. TaxID=2048138 RepID=UPI003D936278